VWDIFVFRPTEQRRITTAIVIIYISLIFYLTFTAQESIRTILLGSDFIDYGRDDFEEVMMQQNLFVAFLHRSCVRFIEFRMLWVPNCFGDLFVTYFVMLMMTLMTATMFGAYSDLVRQFCSSKYTHAQANSACYQLDGK